MSLTRILCEKCGCPFAFCACDRIAAPDGPANDKPLPEEHQKAPPDGAKETPSVEDVEEVIREDDGNGGSFPRHVVEASFARTLELQRNALRREVEKWKQEAQYTYESCGIKANATIADLRATLAKTQEERDSFERMLNAQEENGRTLNQQLAQAQRERDEARENDRQGMRCVSGWVETANGLKEQLQAATQELEGLRADRERLLNVARGCLDYSGGHRDKDRETFHHGIQTVINALEAAAKRDPNDTQVNALERIGRTNSKEGQT